MACSPDEIAGPDAKRQGSAIETLLSVSSGVDGYAWLAPPTKCWLGGLRPQLPEQFWVHHDDAACTAARLMGVEGFVRGNRIFLGELAGQALETVLRHELVHLAQIEMARRTGRVSPFPTVELEASAIGALSAAIPVRHGADPEQVHPFLWFIAIGVGLYVMLRPGVANAPGPGDQPVRSPSDGQIIGEAIALFVIPGGAMSLGARLGLGFLGRSALAGAAASVSLQGVTDASSGQASSPLLYFFDATSGAVLGFIVPGGVRLIGQAGTFALDSLATYGVTKSDIALTALLAERAAQAPLTAAEAQQLLQSRGMAGQVSKWWLNRTGKIVLYRGQEFATSAILSPIAREDGVVASEELLARLRAAGMSDVEIASVTARWHTRPQFDPKAPPDLQGLPWGGVGIPATGIPGIAAAFGDSGVIYVIRMPMAFPVRPLPWPGLEAEDEWVIFNQIPKDSIMQVIPASWVAPLTINPSGLLIPGK